MSLRIYTMPRIALIASTLILVLVIVSFIIPSSKSIDIIMGIIIVIVGITAVVNAEYILSLQTTSGNLYRIIAKKFPELAKAILRVVGIIFIIIGSIFLYIQLN